MIHWRCGSGTRHLGYLPRAAFLLDRVMGSVGLSGRSFIPLLWFLSTFPAPPEGVVGPAIQYSLAGRLGHALQLVFAPIGFSTVYALSDSGEDVASALGPVIAQSWSMATALSLLVWYVFAPQCISTLVRVRRETNSWA